MNLRPDLQIIADWIPSGARVLDLGSGDGALLKALQDREVTGYGIEIDNGQIAGCIESDINVIHADLDQGLPQFDDQSFDFVILSQTLQAVKRPDFLVNEIIRVGKQAIIGFPNFGHWRSRLSLLFSGRMPKTKALPYSWFDTPNIHFCTVKDFERLCDQLQIEIIERKTSEGGHILAKLWPNLFAKSASYRIQRT